MAKYRFPQFDLDITNPTLTISPVVQDVDPVNMTITADIVLETTNAKFGIRLQQIAVIDLNYNAATLEARVLDRLKDFEVVA